MQIGWHNAIRRPGRLLITVLAFMLASVAAVVIRGFSDGLYFSATGLVRNTRADLWVSAPGAGLLPQGLEQTVSAVSGVDSVTPFWVVPVIADINDRKLPLVLHGYNTATGAGGPWRMAAGAPPAAGAGEIAIDSVLAEQNGLSVGDILTLQGKPFRISGLTAETNSFMAYLAFAETDAVGQVMGAPGRTNYLLVTFTPGVGADRVIDAFPGGLSIETASSMLAERERAIGKVMGAPLRLLEWVALLVGLAVIALTTYAGVLERQSEYGVMRALGMTGGGIAAAMLTEVAVGAVIGVLGGSLAATGVAALLSLGISPYPVLVTAASLGRMIVLGFGMAVVAAFIPLRRITLLDPAALFRS